MWSVQSTVHMSVSWIIQDVVDGFHEIFYSLYVLRQRLSWVILQV